MHLVRGQPFSVEPLQLGGIDALQSTHGMKPAPHRSPEERRTIMSEDETSSQSSGASRFLIASVFVLGVIVQIAWATAIVITVYYMVLWLMQKLFG